MPTNADTVSSYAALLGSGTADELAAVYTPDASVEDPVGSGVRHSHDEIRELYNRIEKRTRTVELLSVHLNVLTGDRETPIDGIDVMRFDDRGRGAPE